MYFLTFSFLISLYSYSTFAIEPTILNEKQLVNFIYESTPDIHIAKLKIERLEHIEQKAMDNFNTNFEASASYLNSKEKALSQFSPTTRYSNQYQIGITQKFQNGIKIKPYLYTDRATNDYVNEGSHSGIALDFSIDLYKNFLGRTTKKKLSRIKHKITQSKINFKIMRARTINSLRKVYWSIIANQESIKISQKLLKGAKNLEKNSNKRFKNKIADEDEVFRNRSLVASREASITALRYKNEKLLEQIKAFIPELAHQKILIPNIQMKKTIKEVMSCLSLISSNKNIPYEYTLFDDLILFMEKELKDNLDISNTYSGVDFSLMGNIKRSGSKANGYSESIDDFKDDGRLTYKLGAQIIIPIGGSKNKTKSLEQSILNRSLQAHRLKINGTLKTTHIQTKALIKHLYEAIKSQQKNTYYLKRTLNISNKKYTQARISLQNLIIDENNFFQSNLIELETKLLIITTLLDYLSIFPETPCAINIRPEGIKQ